MCRFDINSIGHKNYQNFMQSKIRANNKLSIKLLNIQYVYKPTQLQVNIDY